MNNLLVASVLAGLLACGAASNPAPGPNEPPPTAGDGEGSEPAEPGPRPQMTVEQCESQGTVVGDIGDGAVHRPDYLCPNGEPPIGTVPQGIEGAVCCPN